MTVGLSSPFSLFSESAVRGKSPEEILKELEKLLLDAAYTFETLKRDVERAKSRLLALENTDLSGYLEATNNLSDVSNAATARGNLGLGDLSEYDSVSSSITASASVDSDADDSLAQVTGTVSASGVYLIDVDILGWGSYGSGYSQIGNFRAVLIDGTMSWSINHSAMVEHDGGIATSPILYYPTVDSGTDSSGSFSPWDDSQGELAVSFDDSSIDVSFQCDYGARLAMRVVKIGVSTSVA